MKKIFISICVFLFSGNLFAASVNELVFFGDSLSDNGNLYKILKVIPRSPPYYNGRFTNGFTWAEWLGKHYQDNNNLTYSIYAYGGATAYPHDSGSFFAPMTLDAELIDFYAHTLFADKSKKLYVIWIGANDYLNEDLMDSDSLTDQVIDGISSAIDNLKSQGARYFLILNLPDLAATPYAKVNNLTERLHSLTEMHNQKLAIAVAKMAAENPTEKFILMDVYAIFNDLLTNTDQYNQKFQTQLSNLNQACWTGGLALLPPQLSSQKADLNRGLEKRILAQPTPQTKKWNARSLATQLLSSPSLKEAYLVDRMKEDGLDPCSQPEQYVFWDLIHPTAPVHQILAAVALETLELEAKDLFIG